MGKSAQSVSAACEIPAWLRSACDHRYDAPEQHQRRRDHDRRKGVGPDPGRRL